MCRLFVFLQKERKCEEVEEKNFEREVLDRLTKIEVKIDGIDRLKQQVYDSKDNILRLQEKDGQQQKIIDDIITEQKWLKHTVAAAIISGIIGIIVVYLKMGMGI